MMAPTTAPMMPAPCPALYQPSACPSQVATKAPTGHDELGDHACDKPDNDGPDNAHSLALLKTAIALPKPGSVASVSHNSHFGKTWLAFGPSRTG